jgi:hypothetical protein
MATEPIARSGHGNPPGSATQASNGDVAPPRMKVLCAWCLCEGKPGYLGECEPLEDPEVTHSICAGHRDQLLEGLRSRSFPDAAVLIVVGRNNSELYEHLRWSFAGVPGVKVIVDRRMDDRRSAQHHVTDDRRLLGTRRIRQGVLSPLGLYTTLRFAPRTIGSPDDLVGSHEQ